MMLAASTRRLAAGLMALAALSAGQTQAQKGLMDYTYGPMASSKHPYWTTNPKTWELAQKAPDTGWRPATTPDYLKSPVLQAMKPEPGTVAKTFGAFTSQNLASATSKARVLVGKTGKFISSGKGNAWLLGGSLVLNAVTAYCTANSCTDTLKGWLVGQSHSGYLDMFLKYIPISYNTTSGQALPFVCAQQRGGGNTYYGWFGPDPSGAYWRWAHADLVVKMTVAPTCLGTNPPRTAPMPITSLPASDQETLDKAVGDYIDRHPDEVRPLLESPLNDNQFWDSPYADPTLDTDGDGWSDGSEYELGYNPNDPNSKPASPGQDSDGDGYPDDAEREAGTNPNDPNSYPRPQSPTPNPSRDSDGDGWSDDAERKAGTDPYNPNSYPQGTPTPTPTPEPCDPGSAPNASGECVPQPCPDGQVRGADGSCSPPPEPCPEGEYRDGDQCKPNPCPEGQKPIGPDGACEVPPKEPVPDDCGDLSMSRLMAHPGGWARDLIIPCEPLADMLKPVIDAASTRFPFSVSMSLRGWFNYSGGDGGGVSDLPESLGPVPLNWGWLTPLWTTIKTLVGAALYAWFGYWLVDRFAPRPTI